MKKRILLFSAVMAFFGNLNAQIMNPGMEQWRSVFVFTHPLADLETPEGWFTADSIVHISSLLIPGPRQKQVFQSTDNHSGTYSAMLMTRDEDTLGIIPGILSNAEIEVDIATFDPADPLSSITYSGGTAITQRVSEVSAWIKYAPKASDSGWMYVMAVINGIGANGDSVIGTGDVMISQSASFTQKTAPITYINSVDVPDELIIIFMSSTMGAGVTTTDSTTMWVDDVSLLVNDVNDVEKAKEVVSVYPNPSHGVLNLAAKGNEKLVFEAYDLKGQQIAVREFTGKTSIDLHNMAAGVYLYRVLSENGIVIQRGKFNIQ